MYLNQFVLLDPFVQFLGSVLDFNHTAPVSAVYWPHSLSSFQFGKTKENITTFFSLLRITIYKNVRERRNQFLRGIPVLNFFPPNILQLSLLRYYYHQRESALCHGVGGSTRKELSVLVLLCCCSTCQPCSAGGVLLVLTLFLMGKKQEELLPLSWGTGRIFLGLSIDWYLSLKMPIAHV